MEKEMQEEALELDELSGVAGGYENEPENCPHNGGYNIFRRYRNMGPGSNDWGYHLQMQNKYVCKLCGKTFWEDELPG